MSKQPTTRKALYERIAKSSLDEVILEEMIRLGFWPSSSDAPSDPAEEIRRRGHLQRRLNEIRTEQLGLQNEAKLKEEARKKRMSDARERRLQNRERRLRERSERRAQWHQKKQEEIGYLGDGFSAGLGKRECDDKRLQAQGIPVLGDAMSLSNAMGISLGQLRFLAFSRKTSRYSHYQRFSIPKKDGGVRMISAPMPRLKAAQTWILETILNPLPMHDAAHGFRPGRSIVSNATPHIGADVVVNLDLENFFPSVGYRRVKGLFGHFGYSEEVATILALLSTEPELTQIKLDGDTYYVAKGERFLPQGAPSSPAITNLLCRRLDRRLEGICNKLDFRYTRYADDLSFSARGEPAKLVGKLLSQVEWLVAEEGFKIHPDKTRVFRRGRRQEVTGLVVNDGLSVPRAVLRRFRTLLFQIEKDGTDGKRWGASDDVLASAMGFANFVAMVQPEKGASLQTQVRKLLKTYGKAKAPRAQSAESKGTESKGAESKGTGRGPTPTSDETDKKTEDLAPKKKWWKLF
ncbi:MAG: RNA-directed DNA polymerase [Kofleriaceae bacterium]|nr:RNA-directed DNA polymerase [Kofleriaceae bacterium]